MKSPTDPFNNRSLDEAVRWFIKEGIVNLTSQTSRGFFKTFAEHIRSAKLSPDQKSSAQMKLSALQEVYSVQFETSFRVQEKDSLSPPSGLALTPEGNLVVADDFNHRIQIYDKDHRLIAQFGSKGKNSGELHYPKGLAVDPEGNIYVADSWNHRVQKFDCRGKYQAAFGSYGGGSGQLNEPYDVHIDAMRQVVVVERYNHRIQVFSPDGTSLGWIGNRGTLLEEKLACLFETPSVLLASPVFEFPTSIACDSQHHYYIADSGNHRIVKFSPEWRQVQTIGEQGTNPGQFQYPLCVAVGPNDLLYVADLNNDRIQVFTSQGQYLFAFTDAETSVKMPCLAMVDARNRLYLGLTFNAEIPVFQVSAISQETLYERQIQIQPDDFRNFFYQGRLYQESGATDLAANSYARGLRLLLEKKEPANPTSDDMSILLQFACLHDRRLEDNALLLKCLDLFDNHMEAIQQKVQNIYREWDVAAIDLGKRLVRKENALLEPKNDSKTFDKEFYLAEKKDKALYRESRLLFYDYRKVSDVYAEFTGLLIKDLKSGHESCGNNLRKRLERVCGLINHYFDVKEKNEETMIRFFAEAPDDREKWEDFRSKSPANSRIMYLLRHFHYELRTLLRTIKSAALEYPSAPWIRKFFEETFISPQNSHPLLKILLRNHECFYEVDTLLKELIDTWINWDIDSYPVVTLQADNLTPIPYDIEDIRTEDLLFSLLVEGMPLRQTKEGLICGDKIYRLVGGNSDALAARLETIYKNQAVYDEKSAELYNQLNVLRKQRLDLELQSRRADARDKTALIPINKNIYIADFQIDLTVRMQVALDFNEINNLARLLLCGALLATNANGAAATLPIFKTIRNYHTTLENRIGDILTNRKKLFYERAATERALEQMNQNLSAGTLEQSLNMKKQLTQLQQEYDRAEIVYAHHLRVKNILGKLLQFVEEVPAQPVTKKPALKLKYTFGLGGPVTGKFLSPIGITHTPEGNILVSDLSSRILRFSPQGAYRSGFGSWGNLFGLFKYPNNVATDTTGCIYVADTNNGRIQKFTKDGEFILAFGDRGNEKIGSCFSLSIDRENNVWAVDTQNHRIQIYNADGNYIRFIGRPGKNPEELFEPTSVCCLGNGDYLVGDQSEYSLKRFDAQGKLLHVLKKNGMTCDAIFFIASHPVHGIFATETWRDRILHLDPELRIMTVYDQGGRRRGEFSKISGLSIKGNTLAVANLDAHRIHVFELPGPVK